MKAAATCSEIIMPLPGVDRPLAVEGDGYRIAICSLVPGHYRSFKRGTNVEAGTS